MDAYKGGIGDAAEVDGRALICYNENFIRRRPGAAHGMPTYKAGTAWTAGCARFAARSLGA